MSVQDVPGGTIDSLRIVDSGASMHKIGDIRLQNIVTSRRMLLPLIEMREYPAVCELCLYQFVHSHPVNQTSVFLWLTIVCFCVICLICIVKWIPHT